MGGVLEEVPQLLLIELEQSGCLESTELARSFDATRHLLIG